MDIQRKIIYTKKSIIQYFFIKLAYYLISKIFVSDENILKKK